MASSIEQQGDCFQEPEKGNDIVGDKDETQTMMTTEESNFFRIPAEIRAHIFERLDAPSILQLRGTHPVLKSLVDHYIGVNVHMTEVVKKDQSEDDMKSRFEFYGKVALRNLLIGYLDNPKWEHGKSKNSKKAIKSFTTHFDLLFLHPELLKNIQLDGPLHVYYMRKFFLCCRNLINLSASANACVVGGLIFSRLDNKNLKYEDASTHLYKIYLPKLRFLKLFVMDPSKTFLNVNQTENSLSILRTLRSDCLNRIILQVWITQHYTFSSVCWILITFMKLHPTLNTVFICFLYDHTISDTNLDTIEKYEEAKLCKELSNVSKTLKLEKFGVSTKSAHMRIWEGFINEQNNLNHLSLTFSANRSSNWEHLTHSSCKSLNQIFIRGEFLVPFDCFSLERCSNLDEICLHNTNENILVQSSILKNVNYVPKRIKSLILFNTIVATEDLLYLLKKLEKLETLVLFKTGRGNGNGVDVNCLEQVFLTRSLMSVLIVRFVALNRKDAKRIMQMMDMQGETRHSPTVDIEEETDWESEDTDDTETENSSSDEDATESEPASETTEEPSESEHAIADEIEIDLLSGGSSSIDSMVDDTEIEPITSLITRNKDIFNKYNKSRYSSESIDLSPSIQNLFVSDAHHSLESDTDGPVEENISSHTTEDYHWRENQGTHDDLSQDNISDVGQHVKILYPAGHQQPKVFSQEESPSDDDFHESNAPNDEPQEKNTLEEENLQEENTPNYTFNEDNTLSDDFHETNTSNHDVHGEKSVCDNFLEENDSNMDNANIDDDILSENFEDDILEDEDIDDDILEDEDIEDDILENEDIDDDILEDEGIDDDILENEDIDDDILENGDIDDDILENEDIDDNILEEEEIDDDILEEEEIDDDILEEEEIDDDILEEEDIDEDILEEDNIGNIDDVDIEDVDGNVGRNIIHGMNLHLHMNVFNVEEAEEDFFDIDEGENNIAAINVDPDGDDLQLVFEGDIDLEDIDLQEIIQVPEVQVHFVLDTILDVLSTNVRHSHWCRSEDIYGNVVFTLKLCMKTDY